MAIQQTIQDTQAAPGVNVTCYARVANRNMDRFNQRAALVVRFWRSKAAFAAGVSSMTSRQYQFDANSTPTYAQMVAMVCVPAGTYTANQATLDSVAEPQEEAFLLTLADFAGATQIAN